MDRIDYYSETTFPGIFRNRAFFFRDRVFLRYHENNTWKDLSWFQVKEMVDAVAGYLIDKGIAPGDRIAIYSENRPEWVCADLACLSIGAVDVTIYPTSSSFEAEYVINHAEVKICFCSGTFQVNNVLENRNSFPNLSKIIAFDSEAVTRNGFVVSFEDVIKKGRETGNEDEIDRRIRSIDTGGVMTLIYTSGTTGNPKGVMLTTENMVVEVMHFLRHQPHPCYETALSVLSLSLALERTTGYYLILYTGGTISYNRGPRYLIEDFQQIRPSCCITVPRIPEKMFEGIMAEGKSLGFARRRFFKWAVKTAFKASPFLKMNSPLRGSLKIRYALADRMVLSEIRSRLGMDRMTCLGTGGAPLASEVHDFFCGIGLYLITGYGLTETSPVTHCHRNRHISPIKTGSVGQALPMTECRIANDGEILLRGPQVMKGYYRDETATRDSFTDDGFLKSGDIGYIDEDGYLYITDRKKDLIITAGGKNIAPLSIEKKILLDPYIEQVFLVGDRRKYISVLIVPHFGNLELWARGNDVVYSDYATLVTDEKVVKLYQTTIDEVNEELGRVEQIKSFRILNEPFTLEKGEITPTLKIKRKAVQEHYNSMIEEMYKE